MFIRIFPEPTLRQTTLAVLRIALFTYIAFGAFLYVEQDALFLFPDETPIEECEAFANLEIVDMGGTRGYYAALGTSSPLAVVYHGNAGRACDRAFYLPMLASAGYAALFVEYTGYSGDGKQPRVSELLRDVERVHAWVTARQPPHLAVIGESIGSGPASYHAALAMPEKLVLVAPFDTLARAAREHYPLYPATLLLKTHMDNTRWAARARAILIVHGTADELIPYRRARALFDALPDGRKTIFPLEQLDHNGVFGNGRALIAIRTFLVSERP